MAKYGTYMDVQFCNPCNFPPLRPKSTLLKKNKNFSTSVFNIFQSRRKVAQY